MYPVPFAVPFIWQSPVGWQQWTALVMAPLALTVPFLNSAASESSIAHIPSFTPPWSSPGLHDHRQRNETRSGVMQVG